MHGFSLSLGTTISHSYAREIISEACEVVSFFRASNKPYALLKEAAKGGAGGRASLQSPNKTRFTSVHACLVSLRKLEPAFGNANALGAPDEELEAEQQPAGLLPQQAKTFMEMLMESWDGFDIHSPLLKQIDVEGDEVVPRELSTGLAKETEGEEVDWRALLQSHWS